MKPLELAIRKQLKRFTLQAELSLNEEEARVLVLFGASGSGKSVTLKCIAGVIEPDAGYISISGRAVFDSRQNLSVKIQKRNVGYVPQNYALFPHLTVEQNIAFGLHHEERIATTKRVRELLGLMQLDGLEKVYPRQLSGGQQQRVAFARALAPRPSILLLDEPFSALDVNIRAELRQNLAHLSRDLAIPVVFITHDLEEAYMLADKLAVLDKGQLLQSGSRDQIFYHPDNERVARLLGIRNIIAGKVTEVNSDKRVALINCNGLMLEAAIGQEQVIPQPGTKLKVCLRPENLELIRTGEEVTLNSFRGIITEEVARGSLYTVYFAPLAGDLTVFPPLEIELPARQYLALKSMDSGQWQVRLEASAAHLIFPEVLSDQS
ncbi:ABC transporter ATP-binding protein [Candidatus Chlorohelix sp.]|uniref:ABC transporter ATP-binding protein n=1 Tax=Candidatus Chlorohelix sp. TaxID=3139201 RepID=UPI00304549A6